MKLREELQKLQKQLEKTSKNSSLPPAKGFKAEVNNLEEIGKCGHCGQEQIAAIPVGMEAKSPFGDRIAALVTTMRYSHGISYGRMQQMLSEVFGLEISEGAIANLSTRVKGQLESEVTGILQALKTSRVVCSDETSARINGKNQWEWVFQNEQVYFHIIRPSRGADVIAEVMAGPQPEVWVSTYLVPKRRIQRQNGKFVLPINSEIVSMELMQETIFSLAG